MEEKSESLFDTITSDDLVIKEIDGCGYIIYLKSAGTNKGFGLMSHKGNCKNPIHVYNELVSR